MSDCLLTLLDQDSCAHCSGAQPVAEEAFYDRGMEVKTREERHEEEREQYVTDELTSAQRVSARTPGHWNRTKETYGGNDGQVDFESIELEEQDAG